MAREAQARAAKETPRLREGTRHGGWLLKANNKGASWAGANRAGDQYLTGAII
jgi:hypothetical protein